MRREIYKRQAAWQGSRVRGTQEFLFSRIDAGSRELGTGLAPSARRGAETLIRVTGCVPVLPGDLSRATPTTTQTRPPNL